LISASLWINNLLSARFANFAIFYYSLMPDIPQIYPYCLSLLNRKRLLTHEVKVGDVGIGGQNPIRIQSMTTTDTMDTIATAAQSIRMAQSGAELVRITAPSLREAQNLAEIKKEIQRQGFNIPLIADIHFTPNAAELAARIVEKVRVNPGNYADKKKFEEKEYTQSSYQAELERIHNRFAPLVKICKENGTAMRIGTNHGSLSDRIMSHYGDSPLGMVESALEFLDICEMYQYYNVVLSMKASNPLVMVQAYRMLVSRMMERGRLYPLHLGVTEAGEGEDGRIKSAQGIGALLMDGIGDTVRVSLTEEPEFESPVAKFLVDIFEAGTYESGVAEQPIENPVTPFEFQRRESQTVSPFGKGNVPRVVAHAPATGISRDFLASIGYNYHAPSDKYFIADMAADFVYTASEVPGFDLPGGLKVIHDFATWQLLRDRANKFPLFHSANAFLNAAEKSADLNFVEVNHQSIPVWSESLSHAPIVWVLTGEDRGTGHQWRFLSLSLIQAGFKQPFILKTHCPEKFSFHDDSSILPLWKTSDEAKQQLFLGAVSGALLVDGLVEGLWISPGGELANRSSFGMLQAARLRITKTEYISCPSCGRTLFDLQETTARIRKRTEHLKGVKIGIMGCIVNGPGEMADADYGYVGVGPGKIALYRGKVVVEKAVQTAEAVDKLIELIKNDGVWVEPTVTH
jgi:(E)-4-hydroxy-3-methylbut-2-enyl-diphosphate synthase